MTEPYASHDASEIEPTATMPKSERLLTPMTHRPPCPACVNMNENEKKNL
jgi:hypothetical protein